MLSACISLLTFAYSFPAKLDYDITLQFDGYLPIVGGTEGKVDAQIGLRVTPEKVDAEGNAQVSSELTAMVAKLDGEKLPFTVENVKGFFPKSTISFSPEGKILKNGAPDITLPFRLPGLDAKRFPETTFMPVEFPKDGMTVGTPFTYTKPFGDSLVTYKVTPAKVDDSKMTLDLVLTQSYETLEDEAKNLTTKEAEAAYRVKTTVSGSGTAVFDGEKHSLTTMSLSANSQSTVTPIKGGPTENRALKTTISVKRKD